MRSHTRNAEILSQVPPTQAKQNSSRYRESRRDANTNRSERSEALPHLPDVLQLHTDRSPSLQDRRRRRLVLLAATASNKSAVPRPLGTGGGCVRRVYVPFSRQSASNGVQHSHSQKVTKCHDRSNQRCQEKSPRDALQRRERRLRRLVVDSRSPAARSRERSQNETFHNFRAEDTTLCHVEGPTSSPSRRVQDVMQRHYKRNLGGTVFTSKHSGLGAMLDAAAGSTSLCVSRLSTDADDRSSSPSKQRTKAPTKPKRNKLVKISPSRQIRSFDGFGAANQCAVQTVELHEHPTAALATATKTRPVDVSLPAPNDPSKNPRLPSPPKTAPSAVLAQHSADSMLLQHRKENTRSRHGQAQSHVALENHVVDNFADLPLLSLYSTSTTSGTLWKGAASPPPGRPLVTDMSPRGVPSSTLRTQSALTRRDLIHFANDVDQIPCATDYRSPPRPIYSRDGKVPSVNQRARGGSPTRFLPEISQQFSPRTTPLRCANTSFAPYNEAREIASLRNMLHDALPPQQSTKVSSKSRKPSSPKTKFKKSEQATETNE